jgi:hypothetical protein
MFAEREKTVANLLFQSHEFPPKAFGPGGIVVARGRNVRGPLPNHDLIDGSNVSHWI